jgi:hypothetical protein
VAHLRRSGFLLLPFPALTGWANLWRAYGAWRESKGPCSSCRIAAEAVGEPGDGGEHAEVAEDADGGADFLVQGQEAPLGEENFPVGVSRANKGQCGGAGVGHVGTDVGEIFEEPEDAEGETGGFALKEKVGGAEQGDEEFAEGSAEDADGVAEPTEEEVAAFVDDEIDVIEDEEASAAGHGVEKE